MKTTFCIAIALTLLLLFAVPVGAQEENFDLASAPTVTTTVEQVAASSVFLPALYAEHQMAAAAEVTSTQPVDWGAFNKRALPLELQAWWTPAFGHIHIATRLPHGQEVSGTMTLPVRIVLHDNPATLQYLRIDTDKSTFLRVALGNLRCATSICAWAFTVNLDTTKMTNGWRELRLRAETTAPDGKKYLPSSGIPVYVKNGTGSPSNYNRFCNNTSLIGRGWYDGFGYSNAIIECVPLAPVSGVVTFRVRAQEPSQRLIVEMDKSHFIPAVGIWPQQADTPGVTLFDRTGDYQSWQPIAIDTRALANGWHSIAVRSTGPKGEVSQCDGCPNVTGFPAGTAKIWFFVQN